VAFSRSPAAVDVREVDRRVTFTVRARDARAGVRSVWVGLGADEVRLHRVSGTRADGFWRGRITVPRCADSSGSKRLGVLVFDRAGPFGNERLHGPAALGAAGWPSQVVVTAGDHRRPGVRLASFRIDPAASIGLRFTETVTGITASSVLLRRTVGFSFPQRYGPRVPGGWACADESATNVDCATGTVRVATFTPTNPLAAGRDYSVMLNPEHTLSVTDLAGNPFKRREQFLRTRR
jgi:Bacterial Ig-like domain